MNKNSLIKTVVGYCSALAIGPTDDDLYLAEKDFNDREVARFLGKAVENIVKLATAEKEREILMSRRKEELRQLIRMYYQERGWTGQGLPKPETLKRIGLWDYLSAEARERISEVAVG